MKKALSQLAGLPVSEVFLLPLIVSDGVAVITTKWPRREMIGSYSGYSNSSSSRQPTFGIVSKEWIS